MKVIIDSDMCLACGICEEVSPEIFSLGSQPYAVVVLKSVPEQYKVKVLDAIEQCPEEAISLEEE